MTRLGIVILSHRQPAQLERLCRRLRASFPDAPVVVHHDFGQAPLDVRRFPDGVRFVRPHVPTRWGDFSLVDAELSGLSQLLREHGPEWLTLISSTDYPLHGQERVLADLEATGADACIEHHVIDPAMRRESPAEYGHPVGVGDHNVRQAIRRYFRVTVRIPAPPGMRGPAALTTSMPWLTRRLSPYGDGLRCHVGSQWFSVRREPLRRLLAWHEAHPRLRRHLEQREAADETYPHTVLAHLPGLTLANRNFRYLDWSAAGSHPRALGRADVPAMYASGAHFARKFEHGDPVLDVIDARLDAEAVGEG